MLKSHSTFEILSTVVMIGLAAALLWQGRSASARHPQDPQPPIPKQPIAVDLKSAIGPPSAKIAIVEYTDYQCPFCGRVARTIIPKLIAEYVESGKMLIAFKNLPLPIHPLAANAAVAAVCAAQQGRFWQMHMQLFHEQSDLTETGLMLSAEKARLDVPRFKDCRVDAGPPRMVESDRAEGQSLGISATPTFLIGRLTSGGAVQVSDTLSGARPLEDFESVVERLLKSK